jgi:hypothetical protein
MRNGTWQALDVGLQAAAWGLALGSGLTSACDAAGIGLQPGFGATVW